MKTYKAVCLDLFGTIVDFDSNRLPEAALEGGPERTTVGVTHAVLFEACPELELERYARAWRSAAERLDEIKTNDLREVSATERCGLVLDDLELGPGIDRRNIAERMADAHMRCLIEATSLPPENEEMVRRLRGRYRLGLISNFDHAPAGWAILKRFGLDRFFDAVVLSDAIGYRKPHPSLFRSALHTLQVEAEETLFVGDTPEADISGPKALGIDAAWIDNGSSVFPEGIPSPDYRIGRLSDLAQILSIP